MATQAPPPPAAPPELTQLLQLDPRASSRKKKIGFWLGAALVLAAAGFGVQRCQEKRALEQMPRYLTEPVEKRSLQVTLSATGTLQGLNTVEVGSEVTGKVISLEADFNDQVEVGQVLAKIDPTQLQAAVDEATAQVASADAAIHQARATLTESQKNLARAEEQLKTGLISQKDYEAIEATAARAQASLASANASATLARASLNSARSRLERSTIISPVRGVVLSRSVELGQTVTAGFQTPVLFKLTEDLTRMSLHVYIDEADVGRAQEGQEASFTVDAYPDRNFPSRVLSIRYEPNTEQNVVTYEAVLSVDNTELLLRPGMTATATIISAVYENVLTVPNAALRFSPPVSKTPQAISPVPGLGPMRRRPEPGRAEKQQQIWTLQSGEPAPVLVKTGASDGQFTQVLEGITEEGFSVIVDLDRSVSAGAKP